MGSEHHLKALHRAKRRYRQARGKLLEIWALAVKADADLDDYSKPIDREKLALTFRAIKKLC